MEQGLRAKLSRREAIIQAINWCIENYVMSDYLTVKRDEVFSMLDLQWNFDEAKLAWFEQGKKQELVENLKSVMKKLDFSAEKAMDFLDVPKDEQLYYVSRLKDVEK